MSQANNGQEFNEVAPDQGQASHQSAAVDYAHAGKTIGEMMAEEDNNTYPGYIISHEQAERLEAEHIQLASTQVAATISAASLADLPGPNEERQWRKAIFQAIRDFRNAVNKPRRKGKSFVIIASTRWVGNARRLRLSIPMSGYTSQSFLCPSRRDRLVTLT